MKLTPSKPVLRVLEKCFAAEVEGRLPAQFGKGRYNTIDGIPVSEAVAKADADGLIERMDRNLKFVTIRGFALTHHGRIAYCEWAAQNAEAPRA